MSTSDNNMSFIVEGDIASRSFLLRGCAICSSKHHLLRCSGCKVVSYCSGAHRSAYQLKHKAACKAIFKSRQALENDTAALGTEVFHTGVGHFWGLLETRDYMRTRFAAADALLQVDTVDAVDEALTHFMDMLRLCRGDNMGVRDFIPSLLLRLGREQECYDFIKWWAVVADDNSYNWGDVMVPYLDIQGADVLEPVDMFCSKYLNLSHLVSLALLKLRLWLHLLSFGTMASRVNDIDAEHRGPVKVLTREKLRSLGNSNVAGLLQNQFRQLYQEVKDLNPYFWRALFCRAEEVPTLPPDYSRGSLEEVAITLHQCRRAWLETEGAIAMINPETWHIASV